MLPMPAPGLNISNATCGKIQIIEINMLQDLVVLVVCICSRNGIPMGKPVLKIVYVLFLQ